MAIGKYTKVSLSKQIYPKGLNPNGTGVIRTGVWITRLGIQFIQYIQKGPDNKSLVYFVL